MKHAAKTFSDFITEATVDSSGDIDGIELDADERLEYEVIDEINHFKEILTNDGAYAVKHSINNGRISLHFKYDFENFRIILDFDAGEAQLIQIRNNPGKVETLYSADLKSFMDAFQIDGPAQIISNYSD